PPAGTVVLCTLLTFETTLLEEKGEIKRSPGDTPVTPSGDFAPCTPKSYQKGVRLDTPYGEG
ncbi:MAG: hypothetical protein AAB303_01875, partial [Chloroflexota bacterium]